MDINLIILLAVVLAIAAFTDIRSRRIPNWLTYPAMAAAMGYHMYLNGMNGFLFSAGGLGLGLIFFIFFYLSGGMGAGDVKLMGAVGGFTGSFGVFIAFLCTALIGGIYALAVITRRGYLKDYLKRYGLMFSSLISTHKLIYIPPRNKEEMPGLCYGAVIALGTSIAILGIL